MKKILAEINEELEEVNLAEAALVLVSFALLFAFFLLFVTR